MAPRQSEGAGQRKARPARTGSVRRRSGSPDSQTDRLTHPRPAPAQAVLDSCREAMSRRNPMDSRNGGSRTPEPTG